MSNLELNITADIIDAPECDVCGTDRNVIVAEDAEGHCGVGGFYRETCPAHFHDAFSEAVRWARDNDHEAVSVRIAT